MCNYAIIETDSKEIECRRIIIQSIENALKRGDEVFERFLQKEPDLPSTVSYDKFKESLKNTNHENLKK